MEIIIFYLRRNSTFSSHFLLLRENRLLKRIHEENRKRTSGDFKASSIHRKGALDEKLRAGNVIFAPWMCADVHERRHRDDPARRHRTAFVCCERASASIRIAFTSINGRDVVICIISG